MTNIFRYLIKKNTEIPKQKDDNLPSPSTSTSTSTSTLCIATTVSSSESQSEEELHNNKSKTIEPEAKKKKYYIQKFRKEWIDLYPWLENKQDKAFCTACTFMYNL